MTTSNSPLPVRVIGGGLAGCEAAWQIASAGQPVVLYEMRPQRQTEAHSTDALAELVCSNSLRSDDSQSSAIGLLHWEMRQCGSLILAAADRNRLPAGSALAVDRDGFSEDIRASLVEHPMVTLERSEITNLDFDDAPAQQTIIATGPLTSEPLGNAISALTGAESLAFFDALAPIIYTDSIDFSKAWYQSRYDKQSGPTSRDEGDYINCPMTQEQYEAFVTGLVNDPKTPFKEWEKNTPYFEGCLPVEVMAERGVETLRYGPLKPVGLTNPHSEEKPYAVVQLRQDNRQATLYNMVGFQTKLTHGAQTALFRKIPGLEGARFARLGGIHRNTFLNGPLLLDRQLRLNSRPDLRFAGQITGVEGYVESAAIGLLAGRFSTSASPTTPPKNSALGVLLGHVIGTHRQEGARPGDYQPMNVNFGLFPRLEGRVKKRERKGAYCDRAKADILQWLGD